MTLKSESRINLVTLGVADVKKSTEFYERLGWVRSSASNEQVTFFQSNGTVLGLFGRAALADDANVEETAAGFDGIALSQTYESEAVVDAVLEAAIACGGKLVKKPQKVFWGGYSGYYADLDGHLWEIAHNPFMQLSENGHMQLPE